MSFFMPFLPIHPNKNMSYDREVLIYNTNPKQRGEDERDDLRNKQGDSSFKSNGDLWEEADVRTVYRLAEEAGKYLKYVYTGNC